MLSIDKDVYKPIDSFRIDHASGDTTVVELRIYSVQNDEPEYFIDMKLFTENEMLELVSALLAARKNWEDFRNGSY